MKTCSKCGVEKELSEFYKRSNRPCGVMSMCKKCSSKKAKTYNMDNKEKLLKQKKEYRKNNKEKIREKNRVYCNKKRHTDCSFKLKTNMRKLFGMKLKNQSIIKKQLLFKYTEISMGEYVDYFKNDILWKNYENGEDIHIDHILPVASFDFNYKEEIKKCWNFRNLRLLPAKENKKKAESVDWNLICEYNLYDLLPKSILLKDCKIEKKT